MVKAVDGVDLEIGSDEIVAIVGEFGSGKSVTALSIMRLIAEPGRILAGEVIHQGKDLLKLSPRQMQQVRGNSISMVFQNPHTSLHPLLRIGRQMERGDHAAQPDRQGGGAPARRRPCWSTSGSRTRQGCWSATPSRSAPASRSE